MPIYQVDHAMMGQDWRGDNTALREFCAELQIYLEEAGSDITIECVTCAVNGARNADPEAVPSKIWETAQSAIPDYYWADYQPTQELLEELYTGAFEAGDDELCDLCEKALSGDSYAVLGCARVMEGR